jgi:hypothetical protein
MSDCTTDRKAREETACQNALSHVIDIDKKAYPLTRSEAIAILHHNSDAKNFEVLEFPKTQRRIVRLVLLPEEGEKTHVGFDAKTGVYSEYALASIFAWYGALLWMGDGCACVFNGFELILTNDSGERFWLKLGKCL